ncbi:MAG: beta-ketoacyl synthase N-terminal-like domain-containing protein [Candidatus Solibacter sp.]
MTPSNGHPESAPVPSRGDIAIIGMGCMFAGAPDLDAYWHNIIHKVDAISDPGPDEWDPKVFYDPTSKANDRVYCKRGGYLGEHSRFRPLDFGIMPVAVDGGEPDQWLALRVVEQAMADAGYTESPKEHLRTEVILGKGTYVNRGNLTVGYHALIVEHFLQTLRNLHPEYTEPELAEIKKELKAGLPPFSADTAPALIGNIIAGRIANRLDLMGPSFTVDAACASALLAIEIGIRDLQGGKCDLVIAGGANVNAPLPTMSLFCQLGALSRGECIRPFDKDADGTLLGEGMGMIVLKRRADAERDGNRIYAVVKGVGVASDGRALHVMAPRLEGEVLALRRAYEMAGVEPQTIGLIEAHGTATPLGDVTEVQALGRVFGKRTTPLPTCALGSVKSMIGHTMPAAGIAGVIKTALALYHRVLPPTINCAEPNPALHLEQTPFHVNTEVRPWIHGADTPRRAGVNSFGFGGINAHVVLEEHPDESARSHSHQLRWDSEVLILEAETRAALLEQADRLREYVATAPDVPLKDLAYTLNCKGRNLPSRLAVIATSTADLVQKLTLAARRLGDPKCKQIKDTGGIYFFDQRLQGKLAFLFPGEGAQYPDMLLDLCLHFPEVRRCFDRADRALAQGSRPIAPSELIYPRRILTPDEKAEVERALWRIDGAVEGVLIANSAMHILLGHLGIRPDLIVGHSTGDYSAMLASGVINLVSEAAYAETMLEWNRSHARLSAKTEVPEATLLAVGADSATTMSIVHECGAGMHLAMDNCSHQTVVAGSRAAADRVIEQLRKRGLIYDILPFDRPYHTPPFRAYAEAAGDDFFARLPICAPRIETWSCTTAARYPDSVEEIRKLFVAHWVQPVLFSETIKNLYADGVRIFVEAGARGNLTAFVGDILRGKPYLAMPSNLPRRSGITQINHLVGALAAQGVPMQLEYLYARRNPAEVHWQGPEPAVKRKLTPSVKVTLSLPPLKVKARPARPLAAAAAASRGAGTVAANETPPSPLPLREHAVATTPVAPAAWATPAQPLRDAGRHPAAAVPVARATPAGGTSAQAVAEFFKGMETFLEVESQVVSAYLNRSGLPAGRAADSVPSLSPRDYPLLGKITSLDPGRTLTALRRISLENDLFLRDHALGSAISAIDPDLRPMIVLPLTMSMEILAEAASVLLPGMVLTELRDVKARQWIRGDDGADLQISAALLADHKSVLVQIRVAADGGKPEAPPVVEGTAIFGSAYPVAPAPQIGPHRGEHLSRLAGANLYDGKLMFHGPCFRGVAAIDRCGEDGVTGKLRTLPAERLFQGNPQPRFVLDPVLLDAAGQLVGYWAAEKLPRGFVVFPFHLDRLRIFERPRPAGELLECRVRLRLEGSEATRSNIEIVSPSGWVCMELAGWADRRFDPPAAFHRAWIAPREAMISEPWQVPLNGAGSGLECYRVAPLFEPGAGLWKELWASLILSPAERPAFAQRKGPEARQLEWLAGRTAAKDGVRSLVKRRYGVELLPADIEISQDEHGRPIVGGAWLRLVPRVPQVSIAHTEGIAIAVVGEGGTRRFGVDVQGFRQLGADFESLALTAAEQRLLRELPDAMRAEWLLRFWCAKEAVAKALGRGLVEGPGSVLIQAADTSTGKVAATPGRKLAEAVPEAAGAELSVQTAREGALITATAIFEKKT